MALFFVRRNFKSFVLYPFSNFHSYLGSILLLRPWNWTHIKLHYLMMIVYSYEYTWPCCNICKDIIYIFRCKTLTPYCGLTLHPGATIWTNANPHSEECLHISKENHVPVVLEKIFFQYVSYISAWDLAPSYHRGTWFQQPGIYTMLGSFHVIFNISGLVVPKNSTEVWKEWCSGHPHALPIHQH